MKVMELDRYSKGHKVIRNIFISNVLNANLL